MPLTFTPLGPTFARTVTAASTVLTPTLTALPTVLTPFTTVMDYRFTNIGTQAVWVAYGATAPTAAIPADGASGIGFMVEPNTTKTAELAYGTLFACIAAAGGSSLYVTIG